jgi:glycosyltransferase involved in cell wall biosynthesis
MRAPESLSPVADPAARSITARSVPAHQRSIVIIINALYSGGAEKTCIELAQRLGEHFDIEVVALVCGGPAERELRALGVKVTILNASAGLRERLLLGWRLGGLLRRKKPIAVITFLYIADFAGSVLTRLLIPRARIFWNIRNNVLPRSHIGTFSSVIFRLNGFFSGRLPSCIVYCSQTARLQHEAVGYHCKDSYVIENSAESVPFVFSPAKRAAFPQRGVAGEFIFLFVGRFDSVKRVDLFVEACARACRSCDGGVRFLIAGRGMDRNNASLRSLLSASGVPERFELLGHVDDQQALYSAADCLVVTSESEGSPNVIYEAMATRLKTVILATVGTEDISGWGVHRLATRDIDALVATLCELVKVGVPQEATRLSPAGRPVDHPLVRFYKEYLSVETK